jgi:general secretion pathway protein K
MALILVLGSLTILAVMLSEFQAETSADMGSALTQRDALQAEYAAVSATNLSRLLIAAEPTIRRNLRGMFVLFGQANVPQIPVWEFASQVLGAFNDQDGAQAFSGLSGMSAAQGENLGFEHGGFEITIVDEDSKINVNLPARGDLFSQQRLAAQLIGLIGGPQHDHLFEGRDRDQNFSDRQAVCSAIIDWTDPDQNLSVCDPASETAQQAAAEDSYYQLLKRPYARKNGAFDSLEELRRVRGIGDDFWHAFIDPDPDAPSKRVVTIWGQGAVNVNTANPQTLIAMVCANADRSQPQAFCLDPAEQQKFLAAMELVRMFTAGAPLFGSVKEFIEAIEGRSKNAMFAAIAAALTLPTVKLSSAAETAKVLSVESKVFSIYATGYVRAGKRQTRVRVHSVVDFRNAPPPGIDPRQAQELADLLARPNPAGNIVYYRIN